MKKTILVDLDGIVVNFIGAILDANNEKYRQAAKFLGGTTTHKDWTPEDCTEFDLHKCFDVAEDVFFEPMHLPGFFRGLQPLGGAISSLKYLAERHDLYIVSTPAREPHSAAEKLEWCREFLPFIHRRHIMLLAAKHMVHGDILIDDSPEQLSGWFRDQMARGNGGVKTATLDWPYNRNHPVDFRAKDYAHPDFAWEEIVRWVVDS